MEVMGAGLGVSWEELRHFIVQWTIHYKRRDG